MFCSKFYYPLGRPILVEKHSGNVGSVDWQQFSEKAIWQYLLGALKMFISSDPLIPFLGLHPKEIV